MSVQLTNAQAIHSYVTNGVVKIQLSREERVRLYVAFKACDSCGAPRGVLCRGWRGDVWKKAYHWKRGPFADMRRMTPEQRKAYRARYEELKQQIFKQREVVGHE